MSSAWLSDSTMKQLEMIADHLGFEDFHFKKARTVNGLAELITVEPFDREEPTGIDISAEFKSNKDYMGLYVDKTNAQAFRDSALAGFKNDDDHQILELMAMTLTVTKEWENTLGVEPISLEVLEKAYLAANNDDQNFMENEMAKAPSQSTLDTSTLFQD